jgi:hypothetical protein
LKPGAFKLWVKWIQLAPPHREVVGSVHSVAVQVAFESKI